MSGQSAENDARTLLALADKQKRVSRWAEDMRRTIRLGRPVKVAEMQQRGPFGRKRKYLYELDDRMPADAVDALYGALGIVRDEANKRAAELEAQVTTRVIPPGTGATS